MLTKNDINVEIKLVGTNKLEIECNRIEDCEYAFYIYRGDKRIDKTSYSDNNKIVYWLSLKGEYHVSAFVRPKGEERVRKESNTIFYVPELVIDNDGSTSAKNGIIYNAVMITKEIVRNIIMAYRVARYDYKLENKDTYLGKMWALLTPLIQIGIYWFVFGVGIRQGRTVDGFPFIIWMMCGIIPWFYINGGILQGANSILRKANTLTRLRFPLATVPVSTIFVAGFEHIMMLLVMTFMFICMGYIPHLGWLNLIYYILYMTVFLVSISLITSVLTVIARDFYKLLQSLMKLMFYLTPVLWTMDTMPRLYQNIMEFNPFFYIVNGFRESILLNEPFFHDWKMLIFFNVLNVILFIVGANLQAKFRNRFIDLI